MSLPSPPPAAASCRRLSGAAAVVLASALVALPAQAQLGTPDSENAHRGGYTRPFEALSNSALAMRDSLVAIARAQVGTRYVLGGNTPDRGFDCSGLVRYVMATFKADLPRTAARQAAVGRSVGRDTAQLRPGDLLTFAKGKGRVSHVGIYVGDGRYVHASSVAGRVIESPIDRPPSRLVRAWRDTRRVIVAVSDTVSDQR